LLTTPPGGVPVPAQASPASNGHPGFGPSGPQPVARPMPQPAPFSIADPVRLRPPAPIGATAFVADKKGNRWIAPVIVGLVAIGLIVAAILLFSGGGDPGENDNPGNNAPEQSSSVPKVKVGGDSPASSAKKKNDSGSSGGPSSLPVYPPSR
jgi:serine/threonine-protein kinase